MRKQRRRSPIFRIIGALLTVAFGIFSLMTQCKSDNDAGKTSSEIETVYLQKIEDTMDNRIIFRHKSGDDHVIYAEEVTTRDFTSSGIEDQEVFEKTLAELFKKEFGGMEGIDYSTEYNGKMVTLTVKFDYNKIDFEKFTQLESQTSLTGTDGVSLSKTIKAYKDDGYVEVKDGKFKELEQPPVTEDSK